MGLIDIQLPNRPIRDQLKVKMDMGAESNILPLRTYANLFPEQMTEDGQPNPEYLENTHVEFECNKSSIVKSLGCTTLEIALPDKELIRSQFFISTEHDRILLGHPACDKLRAYTLNVPNIAPMFDQSQFVPELGETSLPSGPISDMETLKKMYPECFDTVRHFPGEYHIHIQPNAVPVQHGRRKTPIELQEPIKAKLDDLTARGINTPVDIPTKWVNSMTYPTKPNGDIRICLDPKDLNKVIIREHHHPPTVEEITHRLSGENSNKMSKFDAQEGFWAIVLDEESSYLTTFNTPFGRYRYLRLPFGLKCSQDAYQLRIDQILENVPGIIAIHDDITVFGKDDEEHDKHLIALMETAKKNGLVFNSKKCTLKQPEVSFFGIKFSAEGMSPDKDKIQGILDMPPPKDVTQLQSLLGMVNFMQNFIPHLSAATAPLRQLLTKDKVFEWTPSTDSAYQKLKTLISEAQGRLLPFYDRSLPITVQADASQDGLGAALLQEGKPIAFASKSVTDTERRYANIEREMLSIVFACERFHTYLYGRTFIIENDHKPLEMVALKNLDKAPPRLQRLLLRLQPYDCQIKYRPGKEMLLVDALS